MSYQITIVKVEENSNFKEQVAEFQSNRNRFDMDRLSNEGPKRTIVKDVLVTELTEEQYKKVKTEIIKVFE